MSEHYDTYRIGDVIEHPNYDSGIIIDILGESVNRSIAVMFTDLGERRLGLAWVDTNCKKYTANQR